MDIKSLGEAIRSGLLDPVELVERTLDRLHRWEPRLKSTITLRADDALAAAEIAAAELSAGRDRGPLHGIPIGVKDIIDVAGLPTTAASRLLDGEAATVHAPVVESLLEGGAIVLAKTNTHEFAFGALTPPTRNPYDLERMPGGSSGGSAAIVGAGILRAAIGTDTAGSIREPAAMCGVVGLKPTAGTLSNKGVVPLAWSLDTVGPIAASVDDCRILLDGMAPVQPVGEPATPAESTTVVVWSELTQRFQAPIRAAFKSLVDALVDAGTSVEHTSLGDPDDLVAAAIVVLGGEAMAYHRQWYATRRHEYQADVAAYLDLASSFTAADYVDGERVRRAFSDRLNRTLASSDVLLTPAQIILPPLVSETEVTLDDARVAPRDLSLIRPLAPFNLSGHPAVSFPFAYDTHTGLPISAQLVGRYGDDRMLLRLAGDLQALAGFSHRFPSAPD